MKKELSNLSTLQMRTISEQSLDGNESIYILCSQQARRERVYCENIFHVTKS